MRSGGNTRAASSSARCQTKDFKDLEGNAGLEVVVGKGKRSTTSRGRGGENRVAHGSSNRWKNTAPIGTNGGRGRGEVLARTRPTRGRLPLLDAPTPATSVKSRRAGSGQVRPTAEGEQRWPWVRDLRRYSWEYQTGPQIINLHVPNGLNRPLPNS